MKCEFSFYDAQRRDREGWLESIRKQWSLIAVRHVLVGLTNAPVGHLLVCMVYDIRSIWFLVEVLQVGLHTLVVMFLFSDSFHAFVHVTNVPIGLSKKLLSQWRHLGLGWGSSWSLRTLFSGSFLPLLSHKTLSQYWNLTPLCARAHTHSYDR